MWYVAAMELTESQYQLIQPFLPRQRGNVSLSHRHVLNAIFVCCGARLQMAGVTSTFWEQAYHLHPHESLGQAWRAGSCLCRIARAPNYSDASRSRFDDRTTVKVHPEGTGARKKNGRQAIGKSRRGVDHQDSSGCHGCSNGGELFFIPWPHWGCAGRSSVAGADEAVSHVCHYGSVL